MKTYELLEPMRKNGERHEIGATVELDAKTARDKLTIGVIREATRATARTPPPPPAKPLNMQKGDELRATAAAKGVEIPADVTEDKAIRALILNAETKQDG